MPRAPRIHAEPNPTPEQVARVEALEADPGLGGMGLEELEVYLRLLLPGRVHGFAPSLPPAGPTDAPPGTPEKLKVMKARARRGEALFHPQDARGAAPGGEG